MEAEGDVTREKTRIYVGGLGGGVSEDDLRKTFSSLGEVASVDIVRTKGRSFAYLDFLPSSDKSLPKLFSTYNGCMWKGGKLRLEKAKEHYLLKLKREWQQDSENTNKSNSDASKTHDALENPKKPSAEINKQLCLFFPKLGKVKSLGQVGIGKHKYSFQRIQVPPIPTHFCDCEEHSIAFLPTKKNQISEIENVSDGINEQELNIMNSVMNKIFERANPSKPVNEGASMNSIENSEEDHLTDEDNLIINVGTGNDDVDLLAEMRMIANKDAVVAKKHGGQEKKAMPPIKKRKSPPSKEKPVIPESSRSFRTRLDTRKTRKIEVESNTKQPEPNSLRSLKSTWKDLIGRKRNTPFTIPNIIPTVDQQKDESNGDDHPGIDLEMKTNKTSDSDHKEGSPEKDAGDTIPAAAKGGLWRQKSSWTQLVSTANHDSFSISQIVPGPSFENHEPSPTRVVTESTGRKEMSSERKRSLIIGNLELKESCSFMRTETSMNEWKRAKTSKKSNEGVI
ncbi:unnamed protein product [Lactuca virosa]|uniref:RRM domain-containing protein n=1 Tax=Lactuca virosa TaxID=75947 RepID=A0AAU9PNF3_9ASTR|nr:unnamed protein product [Lactuca virosa]